MLQQRNYSNAITVCNKFKKFTFLTFCVIVNIGYSQNAMTNSIKNHKNLSPSKLYSDGLKPLEKTYKSLNDYTTLWEYSYDKVINKVFFQNEAMYCVSQELWQTHLLSISYQGNKQWSTSSGDTAIRITYVEERSDTVNVVGLAPYIKSIMNTIYSVYEKKIVESGNEIQTKNLRDNDSCVFILNTSQNGLTFSENGDIVAFTISDNQTKGFTPLFMRISPSKKILLYLPMETIVKGKNTSVSIESMIRNTDNTYTCLGFWDDTTRSYFLYKLDKNGQVLQFREWQETNYQVGKPILIPLPTGGYCFIHNKRPSGVQFIPITHCTVLSKDFVPEKEFVIEGLKYFSAQSAAVKNTSSIFIGGQTSPEQSLGTFDPKSPKWDYAFVTLDLMTGIQELTSWGDSTIVERLDFIGILPAGNILVGSHKESVDSNKIFFSLKALQTKVNSVESEFDTHISLYPNPAHNEFVISFVKDDHIPCFMSIVNHLGETVYHNIISQSTLSISTIDFPSGIYTIILRSGTTTTTRSIVIQR